MGCNCNDEEEKFSLAKAITSATKGITSIVKGIVFDSDPFVDSTTQEQRLKICESCEHYTTTLKKPRCKICGCFLKYKTSLKDQSCPHPDGAKWPESP
jgi:uncharacterized paraquat-inducible protein A